MPFTIGPEVLQTLQTIVTVLVVYYGVFSVGLVVWTFQDIRRRSRSIPIYLLALVLVVLFNLPGFFVYLLVRPQETLTQQYENSLEEAMILQDLGKQLACPRCKRGVEEEFLICPYCQTSLKHPCTRCGRPLKALWRACPYCTTPVAGTPAVAELPDTTDAAEVRSTPLSGG